MNSVFEKIIEKLEERTSFLSDCTKYGNNNAEQQEKSYSTMIMYEVADLVDDLIEIVKQEAEQYEECYKDCGDCEAYNKEKHHCPKFCKVITEAVKEIEENHNGWISCNSGVLPKRSNSYCVTKMCENDGNPIYETCHEIFWTNDNKWDCERDEDCEWRVIAWKEKDKPYQPKGE